MEPRVDIFTTRDNKEDRVRDKLDTDIDMKIRRNQDKKNGNDIDIIMGARNKQDIDSNIGVLKNRHEKKHRIRGCIDIVIFILSVVLAFFIGTFVDLKTVIGSNPTTTLVITVVLLLIIRIVMIAIDDDVRY